MPTNILLQSSKFYTQYKNGDTFASNPSDTTINLAASVGEKIKLVQQIDIEWFFEASANNPVDYENLGGNLFRFKKANGGSFLDDGFNTNGTLDWTYSSGGTSYIRSGTITNLSTSWMYVQFSLATTTPSGQSVSSVFNGTTSQTALLYDFGLIENNEGFNNLSKVTQNAQSYYCTGLSIGGGAVTMTPQGVYKDWQTGSATAERLVNPSTYVQRYEITHTFIVTPYFIDGELNNLQNNVLPSLFQNNQSLKYAFSTEFRDSLSYAGSAKTATIDYNIGACGWFNQNFNGFANDYAIESVTYEDDASASADGVLINSNSVITVEVSKTSGSFVATDKIGAVISYLAESTDYQDKTTDFVSNFMYDNNYCLAGGVPVAGSGIITETSATVNGSGNIVLVIKTTYSTAQRALLTGKSNPNFLLAINVGDITATNANSDRVMLIADAIEYDKNADISGLMTITKFEHYQHDNDDTLDGYTGVTSWNEDGLKSYFEFELDTNNDAFINSMELGLYAIDVTTNESFRLDSFEIPLTTNSIVSNGIQEIEYSSDRGYILNANSQFNEVSITTVGEVGGVVTYSGEFSQKISWQDWILNLEADPSFYDNTKPNNNLNFKASNYSGVGNYLLFFIIDANVSGTDATTGVSGDTQYVLTSRPITNYDYDLDGNISPDWTATIETFDESETTNLGGAILTDGSNTLMKITWENAIAPVVSAANFWAIHRIEITGQQGYDIIELSNIRDYKAGELLIPISGSSLLDMSVVSGDIVTKCLIDGSKVSSNNSYNLSGRLQNPNLKAGSDLIYFNTVGFPKSINSTITKSGTTAVWDYGDGTALDTTNNGVHTYLSGGPKIALVTIQLDDFANVSGWELDNDNVYGQLDISNLTSLTSFRAQSNNNITYILNPTHALTMVEYKLNGITALTTLDVSGLTGLGGDFDLNGCVGIATLTLPTSSQTFSNFDVRGSDLVDADLTTLTNLTESNGVTIDLGNTATTAAQTNKYLVDLDGMSTGSFTGRTITIDGSCAAPDGSSGGYDGTTAKANLITKGFTVTTN